MKKGSRLNQMQRRHSNLRASFDELPQKPYCITSAAAVLIVITIQNDRRLFFFFLVKLLVVTILYTTKFDHLNALQFTHRKIVTPAGNQCTSHYKEVIVQQIVDKSI